MSSPHRGSLTPGGAVLLHSPSPTGRPPIPCGASRSRVVMRSMEELPACMASPCATSACSPRSSQRSSPSTGSRPASFMLLGHARGEYAAASLASATLDMLQSAASCTTGSLASSAQSLPASSVGAPAAAVPGGAGAIVPATSVAAPTGGERDAWGVDVLGPGTQALFLGLQLASGAVDVANTSLAPAVEAIVEATAQPSTSQQHFGQPSTVKASNAALYQKQLLDAPSLADGGLGADVKAALLPNGPGGASLKVQLPASAQKCMEQMAEAMTSSIDEQEHCRPPGGRSAPYRNARPPSPVMSPSSDGSGSATGRGEAPACHDGGDVCTHAVTAGLLGREAERGREREGGVLVTAPTAWPCGAQLAQHC